MDNDCQMTNEQLHNGIVLPSPWPPCQANSPAFEPMPVPYLEDPPEVVPIDVGRQLFVDDFLIAETTLEHVFHHAQKYDGNPVLSPETELETQGVLPAATPKGGGVWWDPACQPCPQEDFEYCLELLRGMFQ